ncbi:hypothetical protein [Streptococcus marmotae]|uniref:hypothetical protein n=1 Tax=Streptococcus marmotae TaxID=1825069 RepID=UPI000AE307D1|nr:hypothetical protein [Streptococcus marmotae]QBX16895.1 hypothetical protein Javan291_0019 [Streptococcus phage Javan291]
MIDLQTKDQYEDNLYWWRRYSSLADELAEVYLLIEWQKKEIKRLERENWNLKQTKRRK